MPGFGHHSFTTSSEEPPLSNFNSQWDIPHGFENPVSDAMCDECVPNGGGRINAYR